MLGWGPPRAEGHGEKVTTGTHRAPGSAGGRVLGTQHWESLPSSLFFQQHGTCPELEVAEEHRANTASLPSHMDTGWAQRCTLKQEQSP